MICWGCSFSLLPLFLSFFIILQVFQGIQRVLSDYRDARRGPTIVLVQSPLDPQQLCQAIPALEEFPRVLIPSLDRCIAGGGGRGE